MNSAAPGSLARLLDYRVKKTQHKALVHLLTALPLARSEPVVMSRYGVRMRANWRHRTFQYCRYATHGGTLSGYIAAQDRPFTFVDIGANHGLYSLLAARNPHCVSAVAFEPVAATFGLLQDNIALNGAGARIRPVHAAVSLHCGMAWIATDDAHSGVASLRGQASEGGEEIRILGITGVDTLLEGAEPLIVKIDVEGHEETVIDALLASAHRDRVVSIFYEIDARWTNAIKIETLLRSAGFTQFIKHVIGRHYDMLACR